MKPTTGPGGHPVPPPPPPPPAGRQRFTNKDAQALAKRLKNT